MARKYIIKILLIIILALAIIFFLFPIQKQKIQEDSVFEESLIPELKGVIIPKTMVNLYLYKLDSSKNKFELYKNKIFRTGEYKFTDLPEDKYWLKINAPGYQNQKIAPFEINKSIIQNINLKPVQTPNKSQFFLLGLILIPVFIFGLTAGLNKAP